MLSDLTPGDTRVYGVPMAPNATPAPQDVPTSTSDYCRTWLGGPDATSDLSEYGVQTAVVLAMGYKPRNAMPDTCAASGTSCFKIVGYGYSSRLVCLVCKATVSNTQAGLVRKHPHGGKAGILTGPRDQAARQVGA